MHFTFPAVLVLASVILHPVIAEELDSKDVPSACTAICAPIVELTSTCDIDSEEKKIKGDDVIEAECICNNKSFDVKTIVPLCAACIDQSGETVDDMENIMSQCAFTSTTYAPSATALVASVTVSATKPTVTGTSASQAAKATSSSAANSGRDIKALGYAATACLLVGFGCGMI